MNVKEIQAALSDRRAAVVAERTGLHPNTVRNIRDGVNVNPSFSTVQALETYLLELCEVNDD